MTHSDPASAATRSRRRLPALAASPTATTSLTIYGCESDEAAAFRDLAPLYGVEPTITVAPLSNSNANLARGGQCVSVSHKAHVPNSALLTLSRAGVRYLSTRSAGYNHIDLEYAASVGITVENVAYSPDSVADFTAMLALMVVREARSMLRRTDARDYRLSDARAREVRDLTIGVVGTGRIGAAVITRLQGFGCRILAYDVRPKTAATYVSLDDLVRQSDVITLHTPLNADTKHLLDRRRIGLMKQGAVVINTARGGLIDTAALIAALESGRLAGAALDVVEGEEGIFYADCRSEPVGEGALSRLQRLPNVIVTPHTAYYTDRALRDTVENTLVNCLAFEKEATEWTG